MTTGDSRKSGEGRGLFSTAGRLPPHSVAWGPSQKSHVEFHLAVTKEFFHWFELMARITSIYDLAAHKARCGKTFSTLGHHQTYSLE
jgi:hypothetical protein